MKEQRLIDANAIKQKVKNSTAIRSVKAGMLVFVDCAPTIDLETLPIVQELRKKLERVTRERDAAIADLYYTCACETCALQYTDDCPLGECIEPCSHISSDLINNTPYKWRGIQEVQNDE